MSDDSDNIFKILLLGDSTVGKTCFLMRFTDKTFQEIHMSTIGLDYRLKEVTMPDGKTIKVQIWDTAGQDRYRSITRNYYKGADGILLIYDITNITSFNNIKLWITQIKENSLSQVKIIVVGNKLDLQNNKVVKEDEVKKIASEFKLQFFEASAKSNINIDECFNTLISEIYKDYEKSRIEAIKLYEINKTKNGCC